MSLVMRLETLAANLNQDTFSGEHGKQQLYIAKNLLKVAVERIKILESQVSSCDLGAVTDD